MKRLNLLFPQWQGSGKKNDLYYGAKKIDEYFCEKISFTEIPISLDSENGIENKIYAYKSILEQLQASVRTISKFGPNTIFTLGGDCGVELGPVSYLNKIYNNKLEVIWFDAHGDLNTPEESNSHHFHGMPLRTLLGEGNKSIVDLLFSTISPNQVTLLGSRDFDKTETDYITKNSISCFTISNLENNINSIVKHIESKGNPNLYLHIDLDVLDPNKFPNVKVPSNEGLTPKSLITIVDLLSKKFNVVGSSIVEYSHKNDSSVYFVEELLNSLKIL